jgi:2-polyprenyl-3-methyl-5-hydroxy-6-metoxy-1,4-benzoquinol methylase
VQVGTKAVARRTGGEAARNHAIRIHREYVRRPFYVGETLHLRSYGSVNSGDRPVVRGDTCFYLDLARRAGGDVLEIGVGTGRVALELAKAGIRVTGLDLSADMLAIAAEKARRVVLRSSCGSNTATCAASTWLAGSSGW